MTIGEGKGAVRLAVPQKDGAALEASAEVQLREPIRVGRAALRGAAPAILLVLAVLVPFRDKAFTIDDPFFLAEARHALVDPLHPTAFEIAWSEFPRPVRASSVMASGPVIAWLLVPAVRAGGAEWLAHLVQILMTALAVFATVALGLRLGLERRWAAAAGLLLAATPAVLGMAGTAMPDVPAMAFGVVGVERLVAWKQERRTHQVILATVFLALAALTRSHLILVLGIGATLLSGDWLNPSSWRRARWTLWLPLPAALLLTVSVVLLTRDPSPGMVPLAGAMRLLSTGRSLPSNLVAFPIHWVLALPLAVPWVLLRPTAVLRRWQVLLFSTAIALLITWLDEHGLFSSPIAALGVAVLWDVLADGWKRRDAIQLTLGLWLLVPLSTAPYSHLPSKYLLASAPAVALLVAREMATRGKTMARFVLGLALALGVALGCAILRADAAFAGLARRAAAELIAPRVAEGRRVWFAGHWGFQWYAEKAGARSLTLAPPYPTEGDLAVSSLRSLGDAIRIYPNRTRLAHLAGDEPGGRLMSRRLGAGFFANGWGYLPWAWGDETLDEFDLWRIDQSAPTLPPGPK